MYRNTDFVRHNTPQLLHRAYCFEKLSSSGNSIIFSQQSCHNSLFLLSGVPTQKPYREAIE